MGDNGYLSIVIIGAVAVLVGLVLFTTSAQNIGIITSTKTNTNVNFTFPALGTPSDFAPCGQKNISAVSIANSTDGTVLTTANYTITQGTGTDGYLSARINVTASTFASKAVFVNCTYEPYGYINDSGARTVASLIIIFGALLIAVSALPPAREWLMGLGR